MQRGCGFNCCPAVIVREIGNLAQQSSIPLILASSSPRRRELMHLLDLSFTVEHSRYEEPSAPVTATNIAALVQDLAVKKADEVAQRVTDALVIGADTLVGPDSCTGIPFGKPRDREDAAFMLRQLAGSWHRVSTGIAIIPAGTLSELTSPIADVVTTRVKFREMSEMQIDDYISTGEPLDKAGSYGAQGFAARYIEAIDGDFYNVVGLPICHLSVLLEPILSAASARPQLDRL
jgi:septum formation protein